ncbi:MAG: FHA domain-containing protein [Crenarchaeota archaeon]|nr:FHA domain-containing protein [Thermoproteota archaeon]
MLKNFENTSMLRVKFLEVPLHRLYGYELYVDVNSLREITVGRGPENTIIIPDPTVSRRHAIIYREGDKIILKDVGSRNGTYLIRDGYAYRINEIYLSDEVVIRFGSYTLVKISLLGR